MTIKKDRFDLITDFKKILNPKIIDEEIIPKEEWAGYNNFANTMMVIPKLRGVKDIIEQNFDFNPVNKLPNLSYGIQFIEGSRDKIRVFARLEGTTSKFDENSVKLSKEYIKVILKLCTNTKSGSVLFKFRKDYPLYVETDEMIIVLAPIVEN